MQGLLKDFWQDVWREGCLAALCLLNWY